MKKVSAFETACWVAGLSAIAFILLYIRESYAIGKPWKMYAADFEWLTPDSLLVICVVGLVAFCGYWYLLIRGARWNSQRRARINMEAFGNSTGALTDEHKESIYAALRGEKEGK